MTRWQAGDMLRLQERREKAEHVRQGIVDDNDGLRDGHATFVLPWPPTLNNNLTGNHYLTDEHRAFRRRVAALMIMVSRPLRGRLSVAITCYPPDKRRRDLDNLIKPVLDALQRAGLFADDEQVDDIRIIRTRSVGQGSITVTVAEI